MLAKDKMTLKDQAGAYLEKVSKEVAQSQDKSDVGSSYGEETENLKQNRKLKVFRHLNCSAAICHLRPAVQAAGDAVYMSVESPG